MELHIYTLICGKHSCHLLRGEALLPVEGVSEGPELLLGKLPHLALPCSLGTEASLSPSSEFDGEAAGLSKVKTHMFLWQVGHGGGHPSAPTLHSLAHPLQQANTGPRQHARHLQRCLILTRLLNGRMAGAQSDSRQGSNLVLAGWRDWLVRRL